MFMYIIHVHECFVYFRILNKHKNGAYVSLSVRMYVLRYVREFLAVDTSFEGVSGSKRNLVGVF